MTKMTEWVDVTDEPAPSPIPKCPKSIIGHRWILTVEDGRLTFTIQEGEECAMYDFGDGRLGKVCENDLADYICNDPDAIAMNEGIPVQLAFHVEHGYYGDDVYGWLDVTPVEVRADGH